MRAATHDAIADAESDELLTTGEAAKLLNSSRQHVVDLCDRGDLPYTTVGKHRRIRRADVEAIRTRTQTMTRDQRRSLWLAYGTAGEIVRDPARARSIARANLARMRESSRGQTQRWLDDWTELMGGPIDRLLAALVSPSPKGRELRQNAPFAGLLSETDRTQILDVWRTRDDGDG